MTKEQILGKICYVDAVSECCAETGDVSCEKCELELSILLDKYAKQIRADAIDEMVTALGTEPFSAYVMDIIYHWQKKLKEQK